MIDVVSDLHLDNAMTGGPFGWVGATFAFHKYKTPGTDVLLVVGDTANTDEDMTDVLNRASSYYEHVVAVRGNHESPYRTPVTLQPNVRVLDWTFGLQHRLSDTLFVGGCLKAGDPGLEIVAGAANMAQYDDTIGRVVVLSHVAPSPRLSEIFGGADISHKTNDLLERLENPRKPSAIVFGHLHVPVDTTMYGWRLFSNPRGYRGQRRDGSWWQSFQTI